MATFKLYSDIVDEEEKVFLEEWGLNGHCYKDIDEFLASIPADDEVIDIRIHCRGGSCVEGWAMYDALRRSKKKIYATVEGECSSMATVILLAAPLERRTAYKNAHFCIHNPAVMCLDTDLPKRLTADGINTIKTQIGIQEKCLRDEQEKLIQLYISRTNAGRKELQEIMDQDTLIDTKKAIELGFISKTLVPNTALRTNKSNNMSKPNTTVAVRKSVLDRILAKCGLSRLEDVSMRDQVCTDKEGKEFTVEREDGDPQVGDTAYPDGTYTMDNGDVITIEDNLITSITPGEQPAEGGEPEPSTEPADPDDPNAAADPATSPEIPEPAPAEGEPSQDDSELEKRIAELETKVSEQENRIAELEEQNGDLQKEVEAKKDARIVSEEENAILNAVASAGGKEWLDGVTKLRSTFHAGNRRFVDHVSPSPAPEGESKTKRAIREQKERYAASKK